MDLPDLDRTTASDLQRKRWRLRSNKGGVVNSGEGCHSRACGLKCRPTSDHSLRVGMGSSSTARLRPIRPATRTTDAGAVTVFDLMFASSATSL